MDTTGESDRLSYIYVKSVVRKVTTEDVMGSFADRCLYTVLHKDAYNSST